MTALYLSRTITDMPMNLFIPAFFGSIVYWLSGMPAALATFITFIGLLMCHAFCAASLGALVGCAAPSKQVAQMLMPLVIMPQIMFAGFMINLDSIPTFFV